MEEVRALGIEARSYSESVDTGAPEEPVIGKNYRSHRQKIQETCAFPLTRGGIFPSPKDRNRREPFCGVFRPARQFAGARKDRACFRRVISLGPDQRVAEGLFAQESVHVGSGEGGVDIAEGAVFAHLLRGAQQPGHGGAIQ